jgi:beta-glucosidase
MFPNSLINYNYKPAEKQEKHEGMYDYASDVAIQYEFGHGLSYTTFEYSEFKLSSTELTPDGNIQTSIKITNTGKRKGSETILLYTSDEYASITPDNKRLCRFEKVELDPGKSTTVAFKISPKDLAFYDYNNQLVAEKGTFVIQIMGFNKMFSLSETVKFNQASKLKL